MFLYIKDFFCRFVKKIYHIVAFTELKFNLFLSILFLSSPIPPICFHMVNVFLIMKYLLLDIKQQTNNQPLTFIVTFCE
jgi:hypothetical protein